MFTGIIQALGTVRQLETRGGDVRLHIAAGKLGMADVELGDSIAVNGVCLTVINQTTQDFCADVSRETLSLTSLAQLQSGSHVNLEKALTLQTHLGGHLVSGHVDGLGEVLERYDDARSIRFLIKAPDKLAKYIAAKGSITIDGVSLTSNHVDGAAFGLNIVPHTLNETIIAQYRVGTKVNLEVDVIARYLERLLLGDKAAVSHNQGAVAGDDSAVAETLSKAFLAEHGFIR